MLAAISIALVAAMSLQQGPNATVRGQVRSEGTGNPLRFAVVEVVSSNRVLHTSTDSLGIYVLRNVPSGRRILRATHLDHAPLEIEVVVSNSQSLVLDFGLELRPVKLPAVLARANTIKSANDTTASGEAALGQAEVKAMEATPGVAELGLAEATREVPGQQPTDPTDVLYVRGGAADLKLVLLNGAPVYAPFHLGGLINALDGDFMRAARLYVGGAPARYDGGLSYVMDLETRAGRSAQSHASLGMDLLGSRTMLEGPITRASTYLIGARSVHGMGARAFLDDPFPYSYTDGIGRLDMPAPGGQLTLTGFWNQETVSLDSLAGGNARAIWGNTASSLRYRGEILGSDADIIIALGDFRTQLPVGGVRPIVTEGTARRTRAVAHFSRAIGNVGLQYGVTAERQRFEFRAWPRSSGRDSLLLYSDAKGDLAGVYVDAQWQIIPRRLSVRSGLRTDVFEISSEPRFAPRLSATWLLSDHATLTVAAGRYRQYVRSTNSGIIGTPTPDTAAPAPLGIAKASHLVISLDQELGVGLRLGLEGYYKSFEDLPSSHGELAEASGVELWVRRGQGRYTGWLGYSLAWVWRVEEPGRPSNAFAGRQLLSAGVSGPLLGAGKFDVRVSYGAGLPFTAIPEPEATAPVFGLRPEPFGRFIPGTSPEEVPRQDPIPPDEQYLRVDAQVAHTFVTELRGFAFELTPYFKLLNALDRRDALFYHFDRSQQDPHARAVAALPVLPILGLEWRF